MIKSNNFDIGQGLQYTVCLIKYLLHGSEGLGTRHDRQKVLTGLPHEGLLSLLLKKGKNNRWKRHANSKLKRNWEIFWMEISKNFANFYLRSKGKTITENGKKVSFSKNDEKRRI